MLWTLSKGAVGRKQRRGKPFWSIFAFLPTEGFESLSPLQSLATVVVGNEGCVSLVNMALWMPCRLQPMVLHTAHLPGEAH